MLTRISALAALGIVLPATAFAHGDHGGGSGGSVLLPGTTVVTFEYDVARFNPLSDDQLQSRPGSHAITQVVVPSLSIAYGLTKDLTIAVRVPYVDNKGIKEFDDDAGQLVDRGGVRGFGDVSVTGTWRYWNDVPSDFQSALVFGLKTPTGKTNVIDSTGALFEAHHQPGSGSWDPILGLTAQKQFGDLLLSGGFVYTFVTKGSQDTNVGDHFAYNITASYPIWNSSTGTAGPMHLGVRPDGIMYHGGHSHAPATPVTVLEASLGLNGQWSEKVNAAGIVDEDTGGHVLFLTPGLKLSQEKWEASVAIGIPVLKDLNGLQSEPSWQLSSGLSLKF